MNDNVLLNKELKKTFWQGTIIVSVILVIVFIFPLITQFFKYAVNNLSWHYWFAFAFLMVMVILFFVNYKLICVDEDNWTANTGDKPPFKNAIKWETE